MGLAMEQKKLRTQKLSPLESVIVTAKKKNC